ncbi:protein THEM6-like, partial [Nilaparvata lugens]
MDVTTLVWPIAVLYIFVDVNYFLRTVFTLLVGIVFNKRVRINETTKIYGICLPSDVDMMVCHMNNARYLRELDFARYHFYERAGLFARMFAARTVTLQTACWIRYRQAIATFAVYTIHTK